MSLVTITVSTCVLECVRLGCRDTCEVTDGLAGKRCVCRRDGYVIDEDSGLCGMSSVSSCVCVYVHAFFHLADISFVYLFVYICVRLRTFLHNFSFQLIKKRVVAILLRIAHFVMVP